MSHLIRTYTELIRLPTFLERYRYLKLGGVIGEDTFGWERYLNQKFYTSTEWRNFRNSIIVRDHGCDLGVDGHEYAPGELIFIHHINPIDPKDIVNHSELLMNPENSIPDYAVRNDLQNSERYLSVEVIRPGGDIYGRFNSSYNKTDDWAVRLLRCVRHRFNS